MAKYGRWVAMLKGDGWLTGHAPACCGSSLGSNPDISQKYKMGDISKEVANTLWRAKRYTKKIGSSPLPPFVSNISRMSAYLVTLSATCGEDRRLPIPATRGWLSSLLRCTLQSPAGCCSNHHKFRPLTRFLLLSSSPLLPPHL